MDCFVINKQRALKFLEQVNRATLPGVYDWFVGDGDVLHIFFHVNGAKYLYREAHGPRGFDAAILATLDPSLAVEGLLRIEEEAEPVLEDVSFDDVRALWGDDFEVKFRAH